MTDNLFVYFLVVLSTVLSMIAGLVGLILAVHWLATISPWLAVGGAAVALAAGISWVIVRGDG